MQNTKEFHEIDWNREDLGCIFRIREDLGCIFRIPNLNHHRGAFFNRIAPERLIYRWETLLNADYWRTVYPRCREVYYNAKH
jgi:hypothetical protein